MNESVVLLDAARNPIGVMDKARVHSANTPLHLGFSVYLVNRRGQLLITRRSMNKQAWPGVWSNSVCGHPGPDEPLAHAVSRRCLYELSMKVGDVRILTRDFQYRAVDANGIMENEHCPVLMACSDDPPAPRPDEVMDYRWTDVRALLTAVWCAPWAFSPWMVGQMARQEITDALLNIHL